MTKRFLQNEDQTLTCTKILLNLFLQAQLIHVKLAIFVCATAGQGDPPDNMKV
jgi:sulfite reductase alpha subunit-like flavoprotein